jgi:hypothetical protein
MEVPPLVASPDEARAAILAFEAELVRSPALAARLAYPRAWLAVKTGEGWRYAFALWAGYRGLTAESYLAVSPHLDGRRADAALAPWFAPVSDPRRIEKHDRRLRALFARAGAAGAPNARLRFLEPVEATPTKDADRAMVDLLEAVYRSLPVSAQAAFRKRIG